MVHQDVHSVNVLSYREVMVVQLSSTLNNNGVRLASISLIILELKHTRPPEAICQPLTKDKQKICHIKAQSTGTGSGHFYWTSMLGTLSDSAMPDMPIVDDRLNEELIEC